MRLYVVVPAYNEELWLPDTLRSLAQQSDRDFQLVIVDNGSTDGTPQAIEGFIAAHPAMTVHRLTEEEKGTGAACDTGFRYAIAQGASHVARTDADCLPDPGWIAALRRGFLERRLEFIGGAIRPREDEAPLSLFDRSAIRFILLMADVTGRIRRRHPDFQYPYFMVAGNNLAICADLYIRAGGFPRSCLEQVHEDRVLAEAVRRLTARGGRVRDAVVYNSTRRLRAYGYRNTVRWYWDHLYTPRIIDIR